LINQISKGHVIGSEKGRILMISTAEMISHAYEG